MMKRFIISILFIVAVLAVLTLNAQTSTQRSQSVTINLTRRGYEPSTFRLKKGVRTRLTFIRLTNDDCGQQVVIPAYNIKRDLPLNKAVTVTFIPRKSGTVGFACGMDMLHGKIIVS